jgi:hypothetical protein
VSSVAESRLLAYSAGIGRLDATVFILCVEPVSGVAKLASAPTIKMDLQLCSIAIAIDRGW